VSASFSAVYPLSTDHVPHEVRPTSAEELPDPSSGVAVMKQLRTSSK
jgi:hypothetical protein